MVGIFGRSFARCARGNFQRLNSQVNYSRSKVKTSLQRSLHSGSRRRPSALLSVNASGSVLKPFESQFPSSLPMGSISLQAIASLHVSSICGSSDSSSVEGSDASSGISEGNDVSEPLQRHSVSESPPGGTLSEFNSENAISGGSQFDPMTLSSDSLIDAASVTSDSVTTAASTLVDLGLGGYSPVGLIQQILEFSHAYVGLPWWVAIIGTTFTLRAVFFPLLMKGQVNAQKLALIKPEIELKQQKLKELSNQNNKVKLAAAQRDLMELFNKHDCHPLKSLIAPLLQLPLFISFFFALKGMANAPVVSLQTGGALWFTDLAAADPYLVLPALSAVSMLLVLETTDTPPGQSETQMKYMKYGMRALSVPMVYFTYEFPAAIFVYWVMSNFLSISQAMMLRIPHVRKYYGLNPRLPKSNATSKSVSLRTWLEEFMAGFRGSQAAVLTEQEQKLQKKVIGGTYEKNRSANRVINNEKIFEVAKRLQERQNTNQRS